MRDIDCASDEQRDHYDENVFVKERHVVEISIAISFDLMIVYLIHTRERDWGQQDSYEAGYGDDCVDSCHVISSKKAWEDVCFENRKDGTMSTVK